MRFRNAVTQEGIEITVPHVVESFDEVDEEEVVNQMSGLQCPPVLMESKVPGR